MFKRLFTVFVLLSSFFSSSALTVADHISITDALLQKVKNERRYVEVLNFNRVYTLPIAINKPIDGIDYAIIIDSIIIVPGGMSYINARMVLEVPGKENKLYFRGEKIGFTEGGFTGNAKLTLLDNFSIDFGAKNKLTFLAAGGKTSISFSCNGFQSLSINGELE